MLSKVAVRVVKLGKQVFSTRLYSAWSQSLSFSSPEADFCHSAIIQEFEISSPSWSQSLSFVSPEADFASVTETTQVSLSEGYQWSGQLSFTSPEADFSAEPAAADWQWSEQYSFASPESDFQAASLPEPHRALDAECASVPQTSPILGLAISSPESAIGFMHAHHLLNPQDLHKLHEVREEHRGEHPLPRTLEDALNNSDPRAIVVTEAQAPFRIVDVNDAWVDLCGYTREEVRNHSLKMIQGPATRNTAIKTMMNQLLAGQETSSLLTNYTKTGRKFYNRVRAGPLFNANETVTHFVGILEEVTEQPEYFQVARL